MKRNFDDSIDWLYLAEENVLIMYLLTYLLTYIDTFSGFFFFRVLKDWDSLLLVVLVTNTFQVTMGSMLQKLWMGVLQLLTDALLLEIAW